MDEDTEEEVLMNKQRIFDDIFATANGYRKSIENYGIFALSLLEALTEIAALTISVYQPDSTRQALRKAIIETMDIYLSRQKSTEEQ
jgi:hypothetical protein